MTELLTKQFFIYKSYITGGGKLKNPWKLHNKKKQKLLFGRCLQKSNNLLKAGLTSTLEVRFPTAFFRQILTLFQDATTSQGNTNPDLHQPSCRIIHCPAFLTSTSPCSLLTSNSCLVTMCPQEQPGPCRLPARTCWWWRLNLAHPSVLPHKVTSFPTSCLLNCPQGERPCMGEFLNHLVLTSHCSHY